MLKHILPLLTRGNIVVAVMIATVWFLLLLLRYEVHAASQGLVVKLDRWTGAVYVSFQGQPWKEIGLPERPLSDADVGLPPTNYGAKPYDGPVIC